MPWFKSKKAANSYNMLEKKPLYLCSVELLFRILNCLVDSTGYESECFISGISYGTVLIPMSIFKPKHVIRTVVSARADPLSIYDLYLHIQKFGLTPYLMCHLHPGSGSYSVHPSPIDIMTMRRWENNYPIIGVIFTHSGYFRFFSVMREFKVKIKGKGVKKYGNNIYKIEKSD